MFYHHETTNQADEEEKCKAKQTAGSSLLHVQNGGALKRATKLKQSEVKQWLSYQYAYTLHKPVCRTFSRRPIVVGGIDHQWQTDLIDVQRLKKDNDSYSYLLTVIDVLSKYAWVIPLKNKSGPTLVAAFHQIFAEGRKPLKLQTDKGAEFFNKRF